MTKEKLKKAIKAKFGTITRFSKISGVPWERLNRMFTPKSNPRHQELSEIAFILDITENKRLSDEIPAKKLVALKRKIKRLGGVREFSRNNPEFPERSLVAILYGERKKLTPKVKELFNHFGV